ncbi:MAG: sugar ABC transporter ATP-binding protein [Actinobacteria bacterium]|nr:sugar ABC transporter ATP-binding protein [Actinomycetota bacterium]
MVNIKKSFGRVKALDGVNLDIKRNEVLALLGDNGAGKTTLIKILSGVYPPDEGHIYFEGKLVKFKSPRQARDMGIETVHQNMSLVDIMSISRNFFLGREPVKRMWPFSLLDRKKMNEECIKAIKENGLIIRTPDDFVTVLSGGERQTVSIGRCMYFGAKLIILDEPMSALSIREQRTVLKNIEKLKESGATIIYISHTIHHVFQISDRFVFLDKGIKIGDFKSGLMSIEDIEETIAKGRVSLILENGE